MKHPFHVGMTADNVLFLEKRMGLKRNAKNEVIGMNGDHYVVKWHLEACSLLIGFDPANPPYRVLEVLNPKQTGRTMTKRQAALTETELRESLRKALEMVEN